MHHESPNFPPADQLQAVVPGGPDPVVRIEQWSVFNSPDQMYLPPEERDIRLHGAVYGHPQYPDGKVIGTSAIIGTTGTIVHCASRSYQLGTPSARYLQWLASIGKAFDPVQPVKVN